MVLVGGSVVGGGGGGGGGGDSWCWLLVVVVVVIIVVALVAHLDSHQITCAPPTRQPNRAVAARAQRLDEGLIVQSGGIRRAEEEASRGIGNKREAVGKKVKNKQMKCQLRRDKKGVRRQHGFRRGPTTVSGEVRLRRPGGHKLSDRAALLR